MRCKAGIETKAERTREYVSISSRFLTPQRAASRRLTGRLFDVVQDAFELIQAVIADHDLAAAGAVVDRHGRAELFAEALFERADVRVRFFRRAG